MRPERRFRDWQRNTGVHRRMVDTQACSQTQPRDRQGVGSGGKCARRAKASPAGRRRIVAFVGVGRATLRKAVIGGMGEVW